MGYAYSKTVESAHANFSKRGCSL